VSKLDLAFFFLATVGLSLAGATPVSTKITILHTSDIHGAVIPDATGREKPGSLARVAPVVESVRKSVGHPVILLDSGDTLQGSVMEEFLHVRWGESSPTMEVMNLMHYQAMAVGNHDFNFGLDVLRRAEKQADFPFLAANAVFAETGEPAFKPFLVLIVDGVRIGVLGLVTSNIPGWEEPSNYEGLQFEPMDDAARTWVPILRNREQCDLVIVLAHTGFEEDPRTGKGNGSDVENFAERLSLVPGIDLLLTGHTHQDISPRLHHGVIISQPKAHGERLTRIDLELSRKDDAWGIASFQGENIPIPPNPVDRGIVERMAGRKKRVMQALATPLAEVDRPVSVRHCREEDCAALDLILQVELEASGADVAMASLLSDSTPDLAAGPVTRNWVSALYTYPNTLRMVRLNGRELKDVMEHAALYYSGISCPGKGPCSLQSNPEIRHYNVDAFAGVTYRIDPSAPVGHRVWDLRHHGKPLDSDEELTLVCNNYRAAGGGGFPHLKDKEILWRSSKMMADLISEYLESKKLWAGIPDGNWVVAPHLGKKRWSVEKKTGGKP